jgi:hypothetical protein
LRKYRQWPADRDPPEALLTELVYGWGNEAYSSLREFLSACVRHARECPGPILECGSGLSTLVLGLEAKRRGLQVWSLEHHAVWAEVIRSHLRRLKLDNVQLCHARLREYEGGFHWYDAVAGRMPNDFALVVCDGPPGETPGGRYGLLPVLSSHFRGGCVILLDDLGRAAEQETLLRWAQGLNTTPAVHGKEKPYGVVTVPASPRWSAEGQVSEPFTSR